MRPFLVALVLLGGLAVPVALAGAACVETRYVDTNVSNQFRPSCVVLRAGDTLTWGNSGIIAHKLATSEPRTLEGVSPCWESGVYAPGQTVSLTLTTDGPLTYANGELCTPLAHDAPALLGGERRIAYTCVFHPSMDGTIVLVPA